MGVFGNDGSLQGGSSGGGLIDWTKAQTYGGAYQASTAAPKAPPVTFGNIAHSFLSSLRDSAVHAIQHPVQTAVGFGKSVYDSAVNDAATAIDLPVNAARGVYHLGVAAGDAIMGNKDAAMKHINQLNSDYQNSYIGKTYGSHSPGDVSGIGNAAGLGLDALTAVTDGATAPLKESIKGAVEGGAKSLVKSMAKGAAKNAVIGGAYGAAGAAQQNDLSVGNIAGNVGAGAATGAGAGIGVGVAHHALSQAISKWVNLRTDTAAAQHQLPAGEKQLALPSGDYRLPPGETKQMALPTGETPQALPAGPERKGIPANASGGTPTEAKTVDPNNPTHTPGPNGAVINPNEASPETARQIQRLNQQLHIMQTSGETVHPDSKTATPGVAGAPKDKLQQLSQIATTRNTAAAAVDSLAKDRADTLRSVHQESGGTNLQRDDSGMGRATHTQTTSNDGLYRKFFRDNGKAPTKADWLNEAHRQLSTGTDEQSKHYQAATEIAHAAHGVYVERVKDMKTSDVYAPKPSPEAVAKTKEALTQAQTKAGAERTGNAPTAETPPPAPGPTAEQLKAHLDGIQSGHAPGSELVALNSLIEHPDVSNADKAHYIQQRDALKPSSIREAKAAAQDSKKSSASPSPEPVSSSVRGKNTTTTSKYTETAATTARKARAQATKDNLTRPRVYADTYTEDRATSASKTKAQKTADNQAALKERLVRDFKKKQAASAKKEAAANEDLTRTVGKASDVTKPSGSRIERFVDRATGGKGSGLINPSRAASRAGNVGLSRAGTELVSSKRVVTYQAKQAVKEFKNLMQGVDHHEVNKVIEGGTTTNPKVQAAANFFKAHSEAIAQSSREAGTLKGAKENYLPHVATGLDSRKGGGASGLRQNTRFNIERQSIEHVDGEGNVVKEDRYKTLDQFDAAVKKLNPKAGAERDTAKLLEHMLITEGHAVENAKTVDKLMNTRMTDGRPALARTTEANLGAQKYKDYVVLDNKMVHPDAKNLYEAISKTGRVDNVVGKALVNSNILSKRLVTLNGIVHAVKIWQSSFASQGVARSVWAIGSRGASKEDFIRALGYGAKFARASNDNLFDEVGKATGILGKLEKAADPLTHALFHNFGDRQGMSAFKFVEAKAIKMGASADEAGRLGADAANQVMHFVPEDQQSIVMRQTSQLALFAGQFLQNTMKTATNAAGVGLDRTLSKEGQKIAQKLAVQRVARMFAYSFAASQALNLATTGKYTWQNGNGDPLNPIWYKDAKTGKEYRITNMYGQLKDVIGLVTNPAGEIQNKLAPGAKELISQVANTDLFTGKHIASANSSEGGQIIDRLIHAATNIFTPAGINLSDPSKQPGLVQAARYLGVNSSATTNDPNLKTVNALNEDRLATNSDIGSKLASGDLAGAQAAANAFNAHVDATQKQLQNSGTLSPEAAKSVGTLSDIKLIPPTKLPTGGAKDPISNSINHFFNDNVSQQLRGADVFKSDTNNKLLYMQIIQQSGSTTYQKFFAANPTLDPSSPSFAGFKSGDNKAIAAGFDQAKKDGTTLAYMQSVQQSGSSYFSKFFDSHPNLDPGSSSFDGTGTKQAKQAASARKYAARGAKYAASRSSRGRSGGKGVSFTKSRGRSLTTSVKPTKSRAVGLSGLTHRKR